LQTISNLCNRFSIIIGQEKWKVQMADRVRYYGYGERLASFRPVGLGVDDFQKDKQKTEDLIRAAAKKAITEDGAEGIILGCTIEFGFFKTLQTELGCPVIDAVYACFKATENAALAKAQFGWKPSRLGSCAAFDPTKLAATHLFDDDPSFNKTIVVK
jgi:allantoin racemase